MKGLDGLLNMIVSLLSIIFNAYLPLTQVLYQKRCSFTARTLIKEIYIDIVYLINQKCGEIKILK